VSFCAAYACCFCAAAGAVFVSPYVAARRCGVFRGVAAFLFFLAEIGSPPRESTRATRESTRATRFYSGGRRFGGVWCERAEYLSVFASVFLRLREMNPDEKN